MNAKIKYHVIPSAFHSDGEEQGIDQVVEYETVSRHNTERRALMAVRSHTGCTCGGDRVVAVNEDGEFVEIK